MNHECAMELVAILRGILHTFCPYNNLQRYELLEDLRALETRLLCEASGATDQLTEGDEK